MRKFLLALLSFAALAVAQDYPLSWASSSAFGNITKSASDCASPACVWIVVPVNTGGVSVQLSGTFSATVQFESSVGGSVWTSIASTANATSATSAGTYAFALSGQQYFRVRSSSFSSGPIRVDIAATAAPVQSGGGGGTWGSITGTLSDQTDLSTALAGKAASNAAATVNGTSCALGNSCTITASGPAYGALADSSSVTWNVSSAYWAKATLAMAHGTASRTLNITNPTSGGEYTVIVSQDSTGGASLTLQCGGSAVKTPNGGAGTLTVTPAANSIDVISVTYNAAGCLATLVPNWN